MRCVLISRSKRLLKVTEKPPLHFSLLQFFPAGNRSRERLPPSCPFWYPKLVVTGVTFLNSPSFLLWALLQSSALGARSWVQTACLPTDAVESIWVYSITSFKPEGHGGWFCTCISRVSFGEINLGVTSVQDHVSLTGGSLKSDKASSRVLWLGKEKLLVKRSQTRRAGGFCLPWRGVRFRGFLISFWRVRELTIVGLEQRKKSKHKAECLICW